MPKTLAKPLAWRLDACGTVLLSRTENPLVKVTPLTAEGSCDYDAIMRLIAAAPDLLEALRRIQSAYAANDSRGTAEEIEASFAAIAKATGDA